MPHKHDLWPHLAFRLVTGTGGWRSFDEIMEIITPYITPERASRMWMRRTENSPNQPDLETSVRRGRIEMVRQIVWQSCKRGFLEKKFPEEKSITSNEFRLSEGFWTKLWDESPPSKQMRTALSHCWIENLRSKWINQQRGSAFKNTDLTSDEETTSDHDPKDEGGSVESVPKDDPLPKSEGGSLGRESGPPEEPGGVGQDTEHAESRLENRADPW